MKPPILTPNQQDLISQATFAEVYAWMNQLHPGRKLNLEIERLWQHLNEILKEKA